MIKNTKGGKDFLGRELSIGDTVVFIEAWKTGSALEKGEIVDWFSNQMAKVRYISPQKSWYNGQITRKSFSKMVKYD